MRGKREEREEKERQRKRSNNEYQYGSDGITKSKAFAIVCIMAALLIFQIVIFIVKESNRNKEVTENSTQYSALHGSQNNQKNQNSQESQKGQKGQNAQEGISGAIRKSEHKSERRERTKSEKREKEKLPVELFEFNPNTISFDSLQLLGFSEKQAGTIINYRNKGGRFYKKEDFAKIYSVSEEMYERLYDYIVVPERRKSDNRDFILEINSADSAQLVKLRGIGGYYAKKIIAYRERIGFFYSPSQLLEIKGIDSNRFSAFANNVTADTSLIKKFSLDTAGATFFARHPYIGAYKGRAIIFYRKSMGKEHCTLQNLVKENIITEEMAKKLIFYIKPHNGGEEGQ